MDIVKQFHIKNGYVVKIDDLNNIPGCTASFPANIFLDYPTINKTYMIYTNPYVIEVFTKFGDCPITSKAIDSVVTNVRLLIIQDIFLTTHRLGISKELIITKGDKTLFKMLEIPMTKKEKELEAQLCVSFSKMLSGDVAITSDVEGYTQVLSCFENGGL